MRNTHDNGSSEGDNRSVAIVGLGYVGLPLALLFVQQGFSVFGIDVDQGKISRLENGRSYLPDITDAELAWMLATSRFKPSCHTESIREAKTIIICVPTPLSEKQMPDMSYLRIAVSEIGKWLQPGQLVVLESSTYPGTTMEVMVPILEQESRLAAGHDFYVGYSPERIDPGNQTVKVREIPKVISGLSPKCLRKTEALYSQVFNEVVKVSSPEVAEMTKLLENTYRLVNISFMNEMAMLCDGIGIDLWEVIEAAKTKSFGYSAFYPGPGVGGHCIPVDPLYLQWRAETFGLKSRFIELAERMNQSMVDYLLARLDEMLPESAKSVLIYGVAYKKNVDDVRESPALALITCLIDRGVGVSFHDPLVPEIRLKEGKLYSVDLTDECLRDAGCVLILTDHSGLPVERIITNARKVLDARNATVGMNQPHIYRIGSGTFARNGKNPHQVEG